eukprot:Protomagalhaensia_sp_Gyna_25__74@NODE_1037_length_2258_cov_118_357819_g827_i0_p2_GENE_NODE_1037_length_2258_cov_118_357819_g827_i0NODE_1037_length_2258_cov_118_357819_g827_i0_p2_ORF_typecomplete_len202_score29_45_NODE_1037_length_2258_cov_118_357819_g827_i0159764
MTTPYVTSAVYNPPSNFTGSMMTAPQQPPFQTTYSQMANSNVFQSAPQPVATHFQQPPYQQRIQPYPVSTVNAPHHSITGATAPLNTFVVSGSTGRIIPQEQPYAFTTVTYAKQPVKPNHDEFKKAYIRQNVRDATTDYEAGPRIVKKQKGACGGCNACFCGCCDTNGGCCGCLNCGGCCDREQLVPVSIEAVPRSKKGCC